MSDGAHDGSGSRSNRPQQCLVAKRQQVLKITATSSDDDHVDVRVGIEPGECLDDRGCGLVSLHRRVDTCEDHLRPTQLGVANDVTFGIRVFAGDESDVLWQERQGYLARCVEQSFGGEFAFEFFEFGQYISETGVTHLENVQVELTGLGVEINAHESDDLVAGLDRVGQGTLDRVPGVDAHRSFSR